jgi:hypothetical protein
MLKKCSKCKEEKDVFNDFHKDRSTRDGVTNQCKICRKNGLKKTKSSKRITTNTFEKNSYYQNNKYIINKKGVEYRNKRTKEDNLFKFKLGVRCNIRKSFNRGSNQFRKDAKTESILGCTIEEFKSYIKSKFTNKMTFDNYGKNGWHLDHIIPLSTAKTYEDVVKLCYYTNFQPLWAKDNLKKGCKIL